MMEPGGLGSVLSPDQPQALDSSSHGKPPPAQPLPPDILRVLPNPSLTTGGKEPGLSQRPQSWAQCWLPVALNSVHRMDGRTDRWVEKEKKKGGG